MIFFCVFEQKILMTNVQRTRTASGTPVLAELCYFTESRARECDNVEAGTRSMDHDNRYLVSQQEVVTHEFYGVKN